MADSVRTATEGGRTGGHHVEPPERRTLRVARGFYPAGTAVEIWYRSYPFCAVRVVEDGHSIGGVHEDDLSPLPRMVVSV